MFLSKLPKTKLANELFIILLVSLSMMVVSKLSKNNTRKKNINYEKILKGLKGLKNVKYVKNLKSKKFSKLMKGGENGNNNMTTELLHDKQIGYEGTKPEQENVGKDGGNIQKIHLICV